MWMLVNKWVSYFSIIAQNRSYCLMVIGVPNVGKSSLINALRRTNLKKGKLWKLDICTCLFILCFQELFVLKLKNKMDILFEYRQSFKGWRWTWNYQSCPDKNPGILIDSCQRGLASQGLKETRFFSVALFLFVFLYDLKKEHFLTVRMSGF